MHRLSQPAAKEERELHRALARALGAVPQRAPEEHARARLGLVGHGLLPEDTSLLRLTPATMEQLCAEHDDVDAMLDELTDRVSGPRLVPARGPSAVSRAASEVGR